MKRIIFSLFILIYLNINAFSNEIISEIEDSWNETKSMSGEFLQTDQDGIILKGKFYFVKPHNSRFEYFNKNENIITNKSLLRIVDQNGYQIESYPFSDNILKKILSEEISIEKEFEIIDLKNSERHHSVLLRLKNQNNKSSILLSFDESSLDLKKWQILDEFGNKTVLEFTKIKKNIFISQNLFVVKYKRN